MYFIYNPFNPSSIWYIIIFRGGVDGVFNLFFIHNPLNPTFIYYIMILKPVVDGVLELATNFRIKVLAKSMHFSFQMFSEEKKVEPHQTRLLYIGVSDGVQLGFSFETLQPLLYMIYYNT